MKKQTKPAQQSITRPVLTGAALAEVKGGVAHDMATSLGPPRRPDDAHWG